MKAIFAIFFCLAWQAAAAQVVVNEVHCEGVGGEEFVEILNTGSEAVDLSGWQLAKGVEYQFPQGARLEAGAFGVIVADKVAFAAKFAGVKTNIWGNYNGKLKSSGEKLLLLDAKGQEIDKIEYGLGFPFPTVSRGAGTSLQLMHPQLNNNKSGHWRSAQATPAAQNHANILLLEPNAPPLIEAVAHFPKAPKTIDTVFVMAAVKDKQGVAKVDVLYQIVAPGAYIRLRDAAYELPKNWIAVAMNDEGKDGDLKAGDGLYTARMPMALQKHRHLVRYRIVATDSTGRSLRVPYADDPQPNFAYFVFDKPAPYLGKYDFDKLRPLPLCQLIAKQEDVQYNIYTYRGDSYKNTGTIVYNGQVYDHIGFRSRGYNNRHARPKRNLKFNFTRGHDVETYDNYGRPYPVKRGKWVLSGTWLLNKPNTHGVAEGTLYKLFNLQGAPATTADYLHLRVVSHQNESDTTHGDFWGLYLLMENFDKDFLQTHDLPDGNIYAYKPPKLRYQLPNSPPGLTTPEYLDWDKNCEKPNTQEWWQTHLDLRAYFGFLAAQEAINNRETGYRKQHWWMEYHNPKKNNWIIFPWDMDATWTHSVGNSTISGAIRKGAFSHASIEKDYQNHLRSFLDLLFNPEQTGQIIDEYTSFIYQPQAAYSFAKLDKLRWGHNYNHDFSEEVQRLKRFVEARADYIRAKLPKACPATPTISYQGAPNYPLDQLVFSCSAYRDTSAFSAMQWRIADVSPQQPPNYEITALWESDERTTFTPELQIPYGLLRAQRRYRLRVRFKNKLGYYSHWSAPLEFETSPPLKNPANTIIFTEVLPQPKSDNDPEFVELKNISPDTIALLAYRLEGAVKYKFKDDYRLPPNAYLLFTNDSIAFQNKYSQPARQYKGSLDKKGETLRLLDPAAILVDSLQYPPFDKAGASLQRLQERPDAFDWQISDESGGAPYKPVQISPKAEPLPIVPQNEPKTPTPYEKMNELWNVLLILLRLTLFKL